MQIKTFFDARTYTLTYVVFDEQTRDALIIDPVLDYEPASSKTFTESVDEVTAFVKQQDLKLHVILETHAHADHLSGSQLLKSRFPEAKVAIGARITDVQKVFKHIFGLEGFATDGRQFDKLLEDGERYQAGTLTVETMNTPGHTPACVTFKIDDVIFTGDLLFMPDSGTGRCDFPAGSSDDMYRSVMERIYTLPESTRVFVGHDYQPNGRAVAYETTVGEEKASNIQLPASRSREDFVKVRNDRDKTLAAPKLLFQSVQVNIDAGHLPKPSDNEIRYLRIPVNVFRPEPSKDGLELQEV